MADIQHATAIAGTRIRFQHFADDPRRALAPSDNQLSSNGCHGEMVGWARALGAWGESDGDSNAAKLDRNLSGFMLGTDKQLDDQWRVGMAAGDQAEVHAAEREAVAAGVLEFDLADVEQELGQLEGALGLAAEE